MLLRSTARVARVSLRAPFSTTTTLRVNRPRKSPAVVLTPAERILLPDPSLWRTYFAPIQSRDRVSVSNPQTAANMAATFVPAGSDHKVVIEAFPGQSLIIRQATYSSGRFRTWSINKSLARPSQKTHT